MSNRRVLAIPTFLVVAAAMLNAQSSAVFAAAQTYKIYDLGPANNPFSAGSSINQAGVVAGSDTVSVSGASQSHAVLWYGDALLDLEQLANVRQPGLLGSNSSGGAINGSGLVVLGAETTMQDPNHENFCAFGTDLQCVAMLWSKGTLYPLANPLGGTNSSWAWINNEGAVSGYAENTVRDPDCLANPPNGTGPQVLRYEAVIWGPASGQFRSLPPLPGDTVSFACGINDRGQVVGVSGTCGNTVIPPLSAGPHAVLWDADGTVHDLGSFGGTSNPSIAAVGNAALSINNRGVIVGTSALPGNTENQPFIWTAENGLEHLPLLTSDVVGAGLDINNRGQVVGASITAGGPATGNPSAVLWSNGANGPVTDLNQFLTPDSAFAVLLNAFGINDAGVITGLGATTSGDVHAYLAVPSAGTAGSDEIAANTRFQRDPVVLSPSVRRLLVARPHGGF